jgi:hypothetical protein
MTTVETTPVYPSYAHPLVSWGSVILGAIAAIAVGVLLNLLVAVFDATAVLHDLDKGGQGGDHAMLLGVFGGLANLIALFTGGFVAARSANHPDHHDGMLHGLGVWALSFVVAFAILGSGASKTVGAALGEEAGGSAATQAMTGATPGAQSATGAATTDAATPPPFEATPAQQKEAEADAQAEIQSEAHDIAKGAAETAFWAFAAMLIGLGAALWGGVTGSRHPEHFVARPRRVIVVS